MKAAVTMIDHAGIRRAGISLMALLCVALFQSTLRAEEAKSIRLAPVIIRDPQVNNLEAIRFLAPVGWKTEGGIVWKHDTWLLATLSMRLFDPASRASITIHPADTFTWSQGAVQVTGGRPGGRYMGSLVMRLPDNVPDVITRVIVPGVRPQLRGAQVTATEELPDLAKVILQQNQEAGIQKFCQAARLRFAYNDTDGTPMDEDLYAVVVTTPLPQMGMTSWVLERAYSVRAERGKLDSVRPVLSTLLTSAHLGEDWVAGYGYVVQLRNNGNMQAIADAGALSRHLAANAEEMRRMNRESYENTQRVQDNAATAVSQTTRGVENYSLPGATSRVELPTGYSHAWYDRNAGEYVLSNDPNFDPNKVSNNTWTPIERTGH